MKIYKDMLKKINFHKEAILKSFIKNGYYPSNEEVNSKLSNIDKRLALFKGYSNVSGSKMNIAELNHAFECIALDIKYLYDLLNDIHTIEYNKLSSYIETHMTYLEDTAKTYEKRLNEEINSTSFGKTIFFKAGNWDIDTSDENIKVDLGKIELINGSDIACFANINNSINDDDDNDIKFIFNNTEDSFTVLPYNYNNDIVTVPGEIELKIHEFKLSSTVNVNDYLKINIPTDIKNDYYIMGGNNLMTVTYKDNLETFIAPFSDMSNPFYAIRDCYITFYITEGSSIEYNFNKKPNHTNFPLNDGIIKVSSDMYKVFLDVSQGFVCAFNISSKVEGATSKVWASKEDGIISDNYILYNGNKDLRDFEIREYVKSKTTSYNLQAIINSKNDAAIIESIYIKEL